MTALVEWLATFPDRCQHGYHRTAQTCPDCAPADEWATFLAALRRAARDGRIHQADVRPLIAGRIEPRAVGRCYSRAIREGLIREISRERSNDVRGRNTNKWEPIYELGMAS